MNRNAIVLAACACFLSGCVNEEIQTNSRVFSYELWVPLAVFMGGALAVPAGWKLLRLNRKLGVCILLTGTVCALGIAPTTYLEQAAVGETEFRLRAGISKHSMQYAELRQVKFVTETKQRRRGRTSKSHYLVCENRDGRVIRIPVSSTLAKAALPHVVEHLTAAGVPYIGGK